MIWPQRLLPDCQCAAEEGLGLGVGALAVVQQSEVVKACGGIGVIVPQRLLPDRQGAKVELFGLGVSAFAEIKYSQVA